MGTNVQIDDILNIEPSVATRKQIEEMVRLWRTQKDHRMALDKKAAQAKSVETLATKWLISAMYDQEWEGIVIGGKITGVSTKEVPDVVDKEQYLDYIRETGQLDLLQFRPSTSAIAHRLEEGVEVPGIRLKEVPTLFNRKA